MVPSEGNMLLKNPVTPPGIFSLGVNSLYFDNECSIFFTNKSTRQIKIPLPEYITKQKLQNLVHPSNSVTWKLRTLDNVIKQKLLNM
jgi:hypothetical protein